MNNEEFDMYFDREREVLITSHDSQFRGFVTVITDDFLILDIGKSKVFFPMANVLHIAQFKEIPTGHYTPNGDFVSVDTKEPVEEWL